jgi:hypothetical protein
MDDNIWALIGMTAAAVAYIWIRKTAADRALKKANRSDEDLLSTLAMVRQCSSLDIFKAAGEEWNFSEGKIAKDFQQYLTRGDVPRYVGAYARAHVTEADLQYRDLIHPGGGRRAGR